ncbi:MAG: hypothetical protein AAF677_13840 [Pseudomonadota bacterium]
MTETQDRTRLDVRVVERVAAFLALDRAAGAARRGGPLAALRRAGRASNPARLPAYLAIERRLGA